MDSYCSQEEVEDGFEIGEFIGNVVLVVID
jgi:hypothetical protein